MKLIKIAALAIAAFFFFASCQKEFSVEQGLSEGTLKEDGLGGCLPSTVNGIFKEDSVLNSSNYIEVQINVSQTGTYLINSDTINGYSFHGGGTIESTGINNIRLYAHGTPADPGINTFTISYDSSSCLIDVPVITVGPPATYTLGGAGSNCTGVVLNGTYMLSVPMIPTNTATVDVNVTVPGSYSLTTPIVNGISFSATGDFATTGPQTVTLNALGTPSAAGTVDFAISGSTSSCTFPVTINGTAAPAVYTLGGAGAACTGFVVAGTYAAGTAMTAANTVTVDVNVTTAGPYTISTSSANGVTFSKVGIFAATGPQTVTLTGTGTPATAGTISYTVNGLSQTCTFSITYTGAAPAAVYTLAGAPGACTTPTVAGTYTAGTALSASNTVSVNVNVTTAGTYTLTTNTVNGMTFSHSGTFATTGPQTVVLTGSGTPVAAGTNTLTPQIGTSSCTFSVTVTGTAPTEHITATIPGLPSTYNVDDTAFYQAPGILVIGGYVDATSNESFVLAIQDLSGASIVPGTYTMAGSGATYQIYAEYTDPTASDTWDPSDGSALPKDPFTITITTITATTVTGTFSGTIRDAGGTGSNVKTVSNGSFTVSF